MNPDHRRWAARPDVLTTSLPDEAVLLTDAGSMYSLSGSAQVVWETLPSDLDAVAQALTLALEVEPTQAAQDALRFLNELQALKLIESLDAVEPE